MNTVITLKNTAAAAVLVCDNIINTVKVRENCQAVIHKGADFNVEELGRKIEELTL